MFDWISDAIGWVGDKISGVASAISDQRDAGSISRF